jgi:BON domain
MTSEVGTRKPQLLRQINTHIFALDATDTITLVGTVVSEAERERTACYISTLEPGKRLVNNLDIDPGLQTEFGLAVTEIDGTELSDDETAIPYFPPTDPVIAMADGEIEILGGFSPTSMDEQTVAVSVDGQVGDAALADAVRLGLREDAATTDLPITVHVRGSIVYLHGRVPDLLDSDNAVEVASRVCGVDEVIDLLSIAALQSHGAN